MHSDKPRYAVILTGLPGSGKTTGASYLKELGFFVISAGDIIRKMCQAEELPILRKGLQSFGHKLLRDKGYKYFANTLLQESCGSHRTVFEGIRPVQVVKILKNAVAEAIVLYIDASDTTRRARCQLSKGISEHDYNEMTKNRLELMVLEVRSIADVIISNDDDVRSFLLSLHKAVSPLL